ncbi:MAG: SUMF1/EgtB/PvdO family nonheme iron enzyme [Desulfohalobiaceae bacterium]|nr:SUMF1/EgtB/PvdO family nonheme iron enzyme [Desulfohalobiaceae bacterium]
MQISGRNFLIPVGAVVKSESDVEFEAVHAGRVLGKMEEADNKLNIVILDACRDNPFKRSFRTNKQGLAQMDAPIGSIIAYATSPGATAADGRGRNGIYTKHLLANLKRSNLPVQEVFMETGLEVMQETNNQQVPWISSTPARKYYLAGGSDVPTSQTAPPETGSLLVWTEPEGAVVYVEGRRQGQAPVKVSGLKPDTYRVEARKEKYISESRPVRVAGGETTEITLRLPPVKEVGRLYVNPTPSDARVRIMNIVPKYHDGIELKPGEYHVRVDKPGFKTKDQWVDVAAGEKLDVTIELKELPSTGRLTVRATPSDARVRLLNSDKGYRDGMELDAGRYQVEVAKSGHETVTQWLSLSPGQDKQIKIGLEPIASGPRPGELWTEPVTGMEFVWVPGGCYEMGCGSWTSDCYDDEFPEHEVCVDGFWMGKHEVTIDEYRTFLQATDQTSGVDWDDDDCPVRKGGSYVLSRSKFGQAGNQPMVEVSWHGAVAFAEWLSRKTGKEIRLPTEAEWEYAARSGGKLEKYAGGDDVSRVAWYNSNSGDRTHRVGTKSPNGLGLYDMSGNVWEWCRDVYDDDGYSRHFRNNPVITSGSSFRVIRGGSWYSDPRGVRAANRGGDDPGCTSNSLGFRLCFPQVR